jgi:O-antigen/teichoic acid export membrane protein
MGLSIVLNFIISIINTKYLGPLHYGDLKFIQTVFNLLLVTTHFGIFVTAGRLIAFENEQISTRKQIGNFIIISFIVSFFVMLVTFPLSFLLDVLFKVRLGWLLRTFSPFFGAFIFQLCLENILQGANRIYELSVLRLLPFILYATGIFCASLLLTYSVVLCVAIQIASIILVDFVLIIHLKGIYQFDLNAIRHIWQENKDYGLQVYIGYVTGVASSYMAILLVGYFLDNVQLGYFSLAVTITLPLTMIPSIVGTTFFKEFVTLRAVPKKLVRYTILFSVGILLLFLLSVKWIVAVFFAKEFMPVVHISRFVAVGSVIHGLGDFYNKFVGAKGDGVSIRNSNIAVAFSNIIVNSILILMFGVMGASSTKIISAVIYLAYMLFAYSKLSKESILFPIKWFN